MPNKRGRIIGAPLEVDTTSPEKSSDRTHNDSSSPRHSPLEPFPLYFKHHGPGPASPSGSTIGPGSDFGPLSPDTADLVYPIRSVVNILQPLQPRPSSPNTFWSLSNSMAGSTAGGVPLVDESCTGLGIHSRSHSKSPKSSVGWDRRVSAASARDLLDGASSGEGVPITRTLIASGGGETAEDNGTILGGGAEGGNKPVEEAMREGYVTARFKHIMTEGGHAVVTGVSGTERLQRCEDEPIHIPGAIQGFGVLIALKEDEDGVLDVKIASEVCSLLGQMQIRS